MSQDRFSHKRYVNMKNVIPDNCLDQEKMCINTYELFTKKNIYKKN